ncbi:PEP-CTERM sorting domain-containing protein [Floridanema evergladense]|uniref:PEP-CTERM sorting domain-containing protein n=1 Tax=Floridaenema evergladense BLCC-F167 TaxID=3153639 RepID=A0ABV4WMT7_9CYAN
MLIIKHLLLDIATLILLETVAVSPAQAFTLSFQSTDRTLAGNIISPDNGIGISTLFLTGLGGSFSGSLALSGMWVVSGENRWFQRFGMAGMVPAGSIFSNTQLANSMPSDLPPLPSVLASINSTLSISLFCHSDSDCLGDSGGISLNMSFTDSGTDRLYSWVGYSGQIQVTAWNPTGTSIPTTPLPTNSVPEPSSASAFLLLGGGWLLRRKWAIN